MQRTIPTTVTVCDACGAVLVLEGMIQKHYETLQPSPDSDAAIDLCADCLKLYAQQSLAQEVGTGHPGLAARVKAVLGAAANNII